MIIKLFREINKLRRFMCGEGLLLTYITICNFTCSFICRNEVVFGISAESFLVVCADFINYIVWHIIYCLYDAMSDI